MSMFRTGGGVLSLPGQLGIPLHLPKGGTGVEGSQTEVKWGNSMGVSLHSPCPSSGELTEKSVQC